MTDWIELRGIRLSCVIGILEEERGAPQPLELHLAVGLDLDRAAGGDLGKTLDYGRLLQEVRFLAEEGRWGLIESVAAVVLRHVLLPGGGRPEGGPAVERARVRVTKPEALAGAAIPSVEMEREAGWFRPQEEAPAPGVKITPLLETPEATAYAAALEPGATWSPEETATLLVTAGTLHSGDRSHEAGRRLRPRPRVTAGPTPARALAVARTGSVTEVFRDNDEDR